MSLLQKPIFRKAALLTVAFIGLVLIGLGIALGQGPVSIAGVACWLAVNIALTHASRVRVSSSWKDTSEKLQELESIRQSQLRMHSKFRQMKNARLKETQRLNRRQSELATGQQAIRRDLVMLQADLHDSGRRFERFSAEAEHGRSDLFHLVQSLGASLDRLDGRVKQTLAEIGGIEGSIIEAKVESLKQDMSRLSILPDLLDAIGQQLQSLEQACGTTNKSEPSVRGAAKQPPQAQGSNAKPAKALVDEAAFKEASRESRVVLGWLKGELVQDVEALIQLHRQLRPSQIVPPLGRGAMDPTAMLAVVRQIVERRPRLVVEVGSGASTIWLGYALKMVGGGRVVSLEHSRNYFGIVERELEANGLSDIVNLRYAPLEDYNIGEGSYPWYSKGSIEMEEKIDMLIVDGPPGPVHPLARYPAVPLLSKYLSRSALIIIDDSRREAETTIKKKWKAEFGLVSHRTLGPCTQSLLFGDSVSPQAGPDK